MENNVTNNEARAKRPWLTPLMASLLLGFTAFIYAPLDTYFAFASEVCFPFTEAIWECLAGFVALSAVCFGLAMLLRGWARNALCALMIGGAVALYLQGSVLNLNYGSLDGMKIDWDQYGHYGRLNFVYWLLAIFAPVALLAVFKKRFVGAMRFICALLAAFLGLGLALQGASGAGRHQQSQYGYSTDAQFELSQGDNIVVFLLDGLDPTTLTEYLATHPERLEQLDGFTVFPNTVAASTITKFGLPMLLSGRYYEYGESYEQYVSDFWDEAAFFHALKARGYRSYLYADMLYACEEAAEVIDNVIKEDMVVDDHLAMLEEWGKLVAFRFAPHSAKKWIDPNGMRLQENKRGKEREVYLVRDLSFLSDFREARVTADEQSPTFHLYHLRGLHSPYRLGADGRETAGATPHTVLDAYMNLIDDYIGQMKALGIYDGATVMITSDHGKMNIDPQFSLMLKRPQERGAAKYADTLVSQVDVNKTVAGLYGFGDEVPVGMDIYAGGRAEAEMRYYYDVIGDCFHQCLCWLDEQGELTMHETGKLLTPSGWQDVPYQTYTPGEWIGFNTIERAQSWLASFSVGPLEKYYGDEFGVWFGEPDMEMKLRLGDKGAGELRLKFRIAGIVGEAQRLCVLSEGELLAETVIRKGDTDVELVLPASLRDRDVLSLTLRFPDTTSEFERNGWTRGSVIRKAVIIAAFCIE